VTVPRPLILIAQLTLVAALSGCATTTSTTSSSASVDAVRAFVVAESGFDAAVQTADLAARSGTLDEATEARIKALADTGESYIVAGRAAVEAANSTNIVSETAALTALVAQLAALSKG
jgi:ABC-type Fe3+-hydroxamate transport system substrate-binding protein